MSARLWMRYETSDGTRVCLSLRGTNVSELVFGVWVQDRCAAMGGKQLHHPVRLANGEWCSIVDLLDAKGIPSIEELITK